MVNQMENDQVTTGKMKSLHSGQSDHTIGLQRPKHMATTPPTRLGKNETCKSYSMQKLGGLIFLAVPNIHFQLIVIVLCMAR